MLVEVYDLESLSNLFTYTGFVRGENKYYQFIIHKSKNELKELINHLTNRKLVMVGYNNLSYDYPLLHHILNHYEEYLLLDGDTLAKKIYEKSQEIINMDFSVVADKNVKIQQLDLYKIHHWDNPAKACSLKHCEMAMRMNNIEEMPFSHYHFIKTNDEIELILNYNKHDVDATNLLLDYTLGKTDNVVYKNKNKIHLRQFLSKSFNLNLLNHNDVKIGEDLVFKLYAKNSEIPEYLLKKQRTVRDIIYLKDCIPEYIKFQTKQFNQLLTKFKNTNITSTKNAIKESLIYNGIKLDYGTGGIHGSNKGIFNSDNDWIIIDADVGLIWLQ